ncbi:MAG: porin [Brucellaceae bacterium]|jgi:hypothetical protein|nr:porin [Brucellaceae bacterium]
MKNAAIYFNSIFFLFLSNISYAADNITAPEPDDINYVRICDTFGKSYFTLPGTQTCLSLGGYVRSQFQVGHDAYDNTSYHSPTYTVRFTLNPKTAAETELGTLKTETSLRFQWTDGEDSKSTGTVRKAMISLGGLQAGLDNSVFHSFTNYLGDMINDDVIAAGGYRTNQINYTYKNNSGFSAILALEQGNSKDSGYKTKKDDDASLIYSGTINDYIPHVVAGAKLEQGWGSLASALAYDSNNKTWATKTKLSLKASDALSFWVQGAYKNNEDIYFDGKRQMTSFYGQWGGDWAVWGGTAYKYNGKTTFNVQSAYDASKTFAAAANVTYQMLPGLVLIPEITYTRWNDPQASSLYKKDATGGSLFIQRSF